jgi:tetratricopeptide (TPR) repeat protein
MERTDETGERPKGDPSTPPGRSGRTLIDAALEIMPLLGKAAPYVIVIGAILFAGYYYLELSNRVSAAKNQAESETAKHYQELVNSANQQLNEANQRINETYNSMAGITTGQIKNIKETFDLLRKTQANERQLSQQLADQERLLAEKQRALAQADERRKQLATQLNGLDASLKSALAALGALGTLVDEAPDLLRAVATTRALQIVLRNSGALLSDQVTGAEAQENRVQILLAFADLQGFIGNSASQEKLARGALALIRAMRSSETPPADLDVLEATAHAILGKALAFQGYESAAKFDESIREMEDAIRQFDAVLKPNQAVKWQQRKAETLGTLGSTVYSAKGERERGISLLNEAIVQWLALSKRSPDAPVFKQGLAWAYYGIGEIEVDQQNLDEASKAYETALNNINGLGERVYRNNEWLDRKAEIHISAGLCRGQLARVLLRERENSGESGPSTEKILEQLTGGLKLADTAFEITKGLAQDENNWSWQASHGSSLHARGELKLLRWLAAHDATDLEGAVADLNDALELRRQINAAQPSQKDWKMYTLWTQVVLNEAKAQRLMVDGDYNGVRKLFEDNIKTVKEALRYDLYSDDWSYQLAANQVSFADTIVRLKQPGVARTEYEETKATAIARMNKDDKPGHGGAKIRWGQLVALIEKRLAGLPSAPR